MANIDITYSYPEELMPDVIAALCYKGGYRDEARDGTPAAFAKQQVINYVYRVTKEYVKKVKADEASVQAASLIAAIDAKLPEVTVN
jgi:hypothetical protein